jgi:hypothetical protein
MAGAVVDRPKFEEESTSNLGLVAVLARCGASVANLQSRKAMMEHSGVIIRSFLLSLALSVDIPTSHLLRARFTNDEVLVQVTMGRRMLNTHSLIKV